MKLLCGIAALLALVASPASAQQAIKIGGPFVGTAAGIPLHVTLVSGEPYNSVPVEPVEVWVWTIFNGPQSFCDMACDASASLMTMDCNTREVSYGPVEQYLDEQFVSERPSSLTPEIARPGGIMGMTLDAVCNPLYASDLTFDDYPSARAGVLRFLAGS